MPFEELFLIEIKDVKMTKEKARMLNPLVLAYVGDSIYDLYVRTSLIMHEKGNVGNLHRISAKIVNAKAQANTLRIIENTLSEEEEYIFHRGRNAHSATVPKNMSVSDYRCATGLEALVGYLFLTGNKDRIEEIMEAAVKAEDEA